MNITHGSILAVFFTASTAEICEGREWYSNANEYACELAFKYNLHVDTAAGVIAALSPNNRWDRNLIDAEALIKAYVNDGNVDDIKVSTFNKNKAKAVSILQGTNPLDALGGRKVRAFYCCIMDEDAVCVDGHAYSIWLGQRVATTKTPSISAKLYEQIANDYRKATAQINSITGQHFTPAQVQAVTWVVWRNLNHG
jgi:hypothetical protein